MANKFTHIPVMCDEMIEYLRPRDDGIYVDGTFGAGGYSRAILAHAACQVIGIDRDQTAIDGAEELANRLTPRLTLACGRFADMVELVSMHGCDHVDGVVLDLGISSMQIDDQARGFSFQTDGPLDMRMEVDGPSAADIVNTASQAMLAKIIYVLGEERRARAIAKTIVEARETKPLTTTLELAQLVSRVLGPAGARQKIHPATRTFQGLRLYVNQELEQLVAGLQAAEHLLKENGRLVVITFHSLEDRIVKRYFKKRTDPGPKPSRHRPMIDEIADLPSFRDVARGGQTASLAEIEANPRARSARLRAVERTGERAIMGEPHALGLPRIEREGLGA